MSQVTDFLEKNWDSHVEDLLDLVKIPSISFEGYPPGEVDRSARAVAELLRKRGLEGVEILTIPDAHPYVYGEWLKAPGQPTLLLYAHHDVQPPGREEVWNTPPFEPTFMDGPEGKRLYGRGTADDKAGIIVHTAAIASFLDSVGELPLNVKVLIEGEEETGSAHLFDFLQVHREKLQADVLVLTDTVNFDCGVPSLTISLRGMVELGIEVRALHKTLHSGMWGGPIPDPAIALSKILADLVDEKGEIAIPGIRELIPPLSDSERERYAHLPFDEARFRGQAGMVDSAELFTGTSPYLQIWRLPSLSVNAIQASSRKSPGNIINDLAWAKVTIRVGPGMDPGLVIQRLKEFICSRVPWGLDLKINEPVCAGPWSTDPEGQGREVFEVARAALEKGYGKEAVYMGCGGTIPFVEPFAKVLGGVPALLVGVEDPYTNAHGENESLLLSDFRKACLAQIHLFQSLSELGILKRS